MNLVHSGEIGIERTWHYALFDGEETVADSDAGLQRLLDLADSPILNYSKAARGHKAETDSVASLWRNEGGDKLGGLAFKPNSGFMFSPALFDVKSSSFVAANGYFYAGNWGSLNLSTQASLMIAFSGSTSATLAGYLHRYELFDGSILVAEVSGAKLSALFLHSGAMYFFYDKVGYAAPFGFFPENTLNFNLIAYLEPLRLYQVQSIPNFAYGTVFDAAKNPAANCKVLAYLRSSGRLVGQAVSASDGSYRCPVLAAKGDEIFMVCLDNDEAPDFEARIIDRITV